MAEQQTTAVRAQSKTPPHLRNTIPTTPPPPDPHAPDLPMPFKPKENPELEEVVKVAGYSRFVGKVCT